MNLKLTENYLYFLLLDFHVNALELPVWSRHITCGDLSNVYMNRVRMNMKIAIFSICIAKSYGGNYALELYRVYITIMHTRTYVSLF